MSLLEICLHSASQMFSFELYWPGLFYRILIKVTQGLIGRALQIKSRNNCSAGSDQYLAFSFQQQWTRFLCETPKEAMKVTDFLCGLSLAHLVWRRPASEPWIIIIPIDDLAFINCNEILGMFTLKSIHWFQRYLLPNNCAQNHSLALIFFLIPMKHSLNL